MKRYINLLEKYLNLLLVFIIPTQLAIHFWPQFSLLFGIRVDYLSPTIYLTDTLFIVLFFCWLFQNKKNVLRDFLKGKWIIISSLLIVFLNIVFSISPEISLIKWLKIGEFSLFSYYVYKRKEIFSKDLMGKVLFYSLTFFSFIGITQFLVGRTIGGPLYFFGERSFDIFTPGIALVNLFGKNFLRIYSTFPHPNSFAGFIGLFFVFFYLDGLKVRKVIKIIGISLITLSFFFTFSLSAFIGILFSLIFYFLIKKLSPKKNINLSKLNHRVFFLTLFASIIFLLSSKYLANTDLNFSQNYSERIRLAEVSGESITKNFLFGTGLNTFVLGIKESTSQNQIVWLLQPVHNTYLLLLSETGIVGLLFFYVLFFIFSKRLEKKKNFQWIFLSIVFILITGLFDHYWLTIQQNMLLISLVLGISARDNS